jgi:phosphatidylserine/phosphatidylglycerophosphate/cardiolipin synthase-like enzyme
MEVAPIPPAPLLAVLPPQPPPQLFRSRIFTPTVEIPVQPLLTPDDYMKILPGALAAAQESILIEQQYIHAQQNLITQLCAAIKQARSAHPPLDVRIVVAPPFTNTQKDRDSVARDLEALAHNFGLATGTNVRLLTHRFFAHLHNKLVIIDHKRVLVSSQNWSSTGVSQNREAGLLMDYSDLAQYYAELFEFDWSTADKSIGDVTSHTFLMPAAAGKGLAESIPSGVSPIYVLPGDLADV